MKRAVRSLKSREGRETSFLLLSNANELFINTILTVRSSPSPLSLLSKPECGWKYHGLESHFKEIISNPAHFNPAGKIELHRRIDPITGTRHSCALECEANMCKVCTFPPFLTKETDGGFCAGKGRRVGQVRREEWRLGEFR
jgi:pyridoxal phosphate phosphatase PHOSPHO2